jgi:hypothetical protein
MPDLSRELGATLAQMARIDRDEQRPVLARERLLRAIEQQKRACAANSGNPTDRDVLVEYYSDLIAVLKVLGREDEAALAEREREVLRKVPPP